MDFYSMPRRQLQALCKQNRIPANITNVAMADALQALHADGLLENAQEVLQDLTPFVPSSRKASLRREAPAPAPAVNFEASIEPREQPASPLPRARRVTVNASEIRRLAVEGEENEKEEVEKEAEATSMTVTKGSSIKPPPRSTRRASKKNDIEAQEEEPVDAMKTPARLTGRRTAAKAPVAVEQEAADTVVSARVTTRRNTRQSTRATIEDSTTSTVRRSSRIRAKTDESGFKMGSSFQEVEPEQGIVISNALVEKDDNGDKDCDLAVVDSDVPQNSLEEAVIAPEAKEFPTIAVVPEEEQLDKVEVDDHCEKGCTLVVVGANIQMHDLEEDRITPNAEELGVVKDELIVMPTEEAPEADVKEVSLQLHLFPKNDEDKPMDMITEKDDLVEEIAPADEQFTNVKEPMDMITEKDGLVDEIVPEDEQFTDVKKLRSGDTKDDSDTNEDGGIHGDQHQVVEVIQESEVPETKCDFEGSPVQGLITSLENLEITKDLHLEDLAPKDDASEHAADEHTHEIDENFHLEDLSSEEDETKHEIPDATVYSFIQNQDSDTPDCDSEVETIVEVIAVTKCQLSGADNEDDKQNEDFHLEDLAPEDDETKHEIPGATIDSFIIQASDIPEKAKAGEVIAVSVSDKENDQYSAELSTDVVVNEDKKKQNVQGNLDLISLRKLKKMYKEKMSSNVDKVETKRQALNDVNQNIVS
ncbi:hypothetical protein ZIOFF_018715 [Zingiber officinale]|uniref:Uncharacterized protein n=1 Tax=Zingiber officinale TaxID=94328 RepID=A0A8J5HDA0_ZINOF|nr:hypothetical protein ZIOFF_018715 [Zingiber officinale]